MGILRRLIFQIHADVQELLLLRPLRLDLAGQHLERRPAIERGHVLTQRDGIARRLDPGRERSGPAVEVALPVGGAEDPGQSFLLLGFDALGQDHRPGAFGISPHGGGDRGRGVARDAWSWRGVPTTSVARTLVDVAGGLTDDELARAVHEAGIRYRTTPEEIERVLARRPASRGAARLRRARRGGLDVAGCVHERRVLTLLRAPRRPPRGPLT